MSSFENFHGGANPSSLATADTPTAGLPPDVAHNYVSEMIGELVKIAQDAQLKDLASLLEVTLTAVKINGRFL